MTNIHIPCRAWLRLPSGRRLDLMNPDPEVWLDSDLVTRLSRTLRWGGESIFPQSLSVAQHCLTVLAIRRLFATEPLSPASELLELLHDAEEGFLGWDCLSPVKAFLGSPFAQLSDRLFNAIAARYKLPFWTVEAHRAHKHADIVAAASEAVHCVGWSRDEVRSVLLIQHPILEVDPLAEIYGCQPWEPWLPEVAAQRFGDELAALLTKVGHVQAIDMQAVHPVASV